MDQKIWAVFSTKEWENFAVQFDMLYKEKKVSDGLNGLKLESNNEGKDGRLRVQVILPTLENTINGMRALDLLLFPMTSRNDKCHVPMYLNACLRKLSGI